MIYLLPPSPDRELDLQLSCLRDCAQAEPVFREDLRRLKTLGSKCNWIPEALAAPSTTGRRAVLPRVSIRRSA
jgi:hypothetical protein